MCCRLCIHFVVGLLSVCCRFVARFVASLLPVCCQFVAGFWSAIVNRVTSCCHGLNACWLPLIEASFFIGLIPLASAFFIKFCSFRDIFIGSRCVLEH